METTDLYITCLHLQKKKTVVVKNQAVQYQKDENLSVFTINKINGLIMILFDSFFFFLIFDFFA